MSKPQKQRRKRGLVLTREGWHKIQNAKLEWEYQQEISGYKRNLDELCEHAGITPVTYRKVLTREVGVDKQTLVRLFMAFNLELEKSDYTNPDPDSVTSEGLKLPLRTDWGEANDVSAFYGRTNDLNILEQWIIKERCRVVAVLGMGGIGKTSLVVKIAQQIQSRFEYVIWRSLYNAPPLFEMLANLIQFVSNEQVLETDLPTSVDSRISRLISYLQQHRCLIVLDNAETILQSGICAGHYREGYEDYGLLIKRVGEISHMSSLLLTSREKLPELVLLEGETLPVRSLQLSGVEVAAGQKIFEVKGLLGSELELKTIVDRYGGNALALKIVATTIQHVFDGNISEFLKQDTTVFGDIRQLLEQQFSRLSNLEKDIMYWLAINREPVSLSEVREDIVSPIPPQQLLESLDSLVRRSLVEKSESLFTQQPVVMEYVTQRLVDQVCQEIATEKPDLFRCHALMKATAKDYIRESQIRLILQPVIDGLLTIFRSKKNIEHQLTQVLAKLRETSPLEQSYTAGNILNLLCQMGTDLRGYDFSYLTVWQANLRSVNLHNANFTHADLAKSVFTENFGGILSIAFSPNGNILAMGDTNSSVRCYQVADERLLLNFTGHSGWVWSISFSPNGHILASGSNDQTIKLWDISTGQCLKTLQGHSGVVWSIAFSPDSCLLASGSSDHTVKLWNINTGECIKTLQGHVDAVCSVAFSTDNCLLATSSDDQTIKLWDLNTNLCLMTLQGHTQKVSSIAFSPNSHILASGCHDQTIKLWDVGSGKCLQTLQELNLVHTIAFSLDGKVLASGSDDHTVKLWDINTGYCIKTLRGHSNRVWSIALSPDGQKLVSSSDDQTVKLWDISTGHCLKTLQGYVNVIWSVVFNSEGNILASSSSSIDKVVRLWNIISNECPKTLLGHTNRVTSVAFSPVRLSQDALDNQNLSGGISDILASGSDDSTVKIWDIVTGQCLSTLQGHSNRVTSISFSPDGHILASGSDDQTVRLWNVQTYQCLHTLRGHLARIWSVAFSTDGQTLVTGAHDQTIKLWNVGNGQCLKTLQGHTDWVWAVAVSPDGSTLASSSSDQTVKLWDFSTGRCIRTFHREGNCVYSLAFSRDGQTLATGGSDQAVKLWDLSTGRCIRTFQGHSGWIWSIAFNLNNQIIASGSDDETIKLWSVLTGECKRTLRSSRPYEGMKIISVKGITEASITTLKALGAVDDYNED
jgi:WD40 repeat protein/GTPase SAR1 family protein